MDFDALAAQLEAELLSEKWDLPEPVFAPWRLLPESSPLRQEAMGYRLGREDDDA